MTNRLKIALVIAAFAAFEATALAAPSAEDLYDEGQTAYDGADYTTAITRWAASYELSRESGLLFNLAQAYRLSGDCTSALSTYKRFVTLDPTADQRALTDDLVRELEPKCGGAGRAIGERTVPKLVLSRPSAVSLEREREPGRTLKITGLVTGGAGVASIAVGLALGHHASTLAGEVTRACALSVTCDWSVQKSKDAAGRRDAALGYAFDVIGIAAIVGGVTMYYLGYREGMISISPRTREGGAVITWSGSW